MRRPSRVCTSSPRDVFGISLPAILVGYDSLLHDSCRLFRSGSAFQAIIRTPTFNSNLQLTVYLASHPGSPRRILHTSFPKTASSAVYRATRKLELRIRRGLTRLTSFPRSNARTISGADTSPRYLSLLFATAMATSSAVASLPLSRRIAIRTRVSLNFGFAATLAAHLSFSYAERI